MFAIYFHRRERITSPALRTGRRLDPLQTCERLGLSAAVQKLLREGWFLQQWGPEDQSNRDVIGGQVDRLRKKAARVADDPAAEAGAITWGRVGQPVKQRRASESSKRLPGEAGEFEYFETIMLPFAKKILRRINFHSRGRAFCQPQRTEAGVRRLRKCRTMITNCSTKQPPAAFSAGRSRSTQHFVARDEGRQV